MPINFVPIEFSETNPSNHVISDITTGTLDGTGVFDIFMQAISVHLQEEFDKNRITGKEYATVYLGALSVALQQAIAAQKARAEVGLLRQQTVTELSQTSDSIPLGLGFNETSVVGGLMAKQLLKTNMEINHLTELIRKTGYEIENLVSGTNKLIAEINLLDARTATEKEQVGQDGVIERQRALYKAQTDGFIRDAEQKLAKIMVDSWSVRKTADVGELTPSGLRDSDIQKVIGKAAAGIDVSL